ncbi:MAG: riboflavin kinase [Planctomycetota bacterium]
MPPRTVLTLGNFDGPHLGHAALIREARQRAAPHQARVVALTFDPRPVDVLAPGQGPPRLTPVDQRIARLRALGANDVRVLRPTPELLSRTAADFVAGLVDEYHPLAIVEGPDFRFGKDRTGDMRRLAELGRHHGFDAVTVPRVQAPLTDQQLTPVSSSLVRWLVGRGRVADAAACLGEPFVLTAPVVRGEQRGRQLNIPTANLDADALAAFIVPADGVYAGTAQLKPRAEERSDKAPAPPTFPAAISVGVKPTFGRRRLTVEAHLLDYQPVHADDLYGRTLTLRFARWVRDQYPFPGVQALRQQLERDIARVRRWHDQNRLHPPEPPSPYSSVAV